jgi:hypothetical protein
MMPQDVFDPISLKTVTGCHPVTHGGLSVT